MLNTGPLSHLQFIDVHKIQLASVFLLGLLKTEKASILTYLSVVLQCSAIARCKHKKRRGLSRFFQLLFATSSNDQHDMTCVLTMAKVLSDTPSPALCPMTWAFSQSNNICCIKPVAVTNVSAT